MTRVLPYGVCMKIENFALDRPLEIHTKDLVKVLILDPNFTSRIRIEENVGISLVIRPGPTNTDLHPLKHYRVSYQMYDYRIHDGFGCEDYSRIGYSYGDCLEKVVKEQLRGQISKSFLLYYFSLSGAGILYFP